MTEQQAERIAVALEAIAKSTGVSAMMQEEQLGAMGDLRRRLAEICELLEKQGKERT